MFGSRIFGAISHQRNLSKWKRTTEVAVKLSNREQSAFLQEATITKKFRHEKLVSLFAVCSKEEPILIVTEYGDYLRNKEGKIKVIITVTVTDQSNEFI
ncbi:tyrosine-protein kinase [Caerostris darwini]|uniref:Tyrosine-protein kinase n=1 Tax=Caerostris darwini TaxID=1538125 RepID=A0AAV4S5U0_9ARAC|nr:tyrosine-protein kinase [Caerostris darwini]